ncbi:hypothetical protein G9A89_002466 [Geosiphon pyriformis]|nr:hypothetical protein G9A89_002466 [Geosiphon pyriformis]
MQQNWRLSMVVHQPISSSFSQTGSCQWNSGTRNPQNPNSQNYLSLLVTPEDALSSNQEPTQKQQTHTSNILPATVTNDELLDAIFPFELEELSSTSLFSEITLEKKPITVMYTDVKKGTPIEAVWRRAMQQLNSCPHDDDKIWRMAIGKIERATPEKIREIKNNLPEPIKLDWDAELVINFLEPEEFHEHYQNLAPTREKQEQWLV